MRLLEIKGVEEISMTEFFDPDIPPYAILSHTWGPSSEEVSFRDIVDHTGKNKAGFAKIEFCGRRAASDGLQYFWVDTCCIDKSSSAELTEAINSMFHWYQKAAKCYVFLSDVSVNEYDNFDRCYNSALRQSRWFSRGWTLQELIAPATVDFFSQDGIRVGDKKTLEEELTKITGIDVLALRGHPLHGFSIADRMSWAAKRTTTREEDNAYCLLGIFDIHMPLIYGEGKKAFIRLKEEVKKSSNDIIGTHFAASASSASRTLYTSDLDHAKLAQWLKTQDPYTNHLAARRKKQMNTGSWFLSGKQYGEWQCGATPLLWISGSPGSGKTVLCSTIIENLIENCAIHVSAIMAYYYFDFGDADKRTLDSFVRSLIIQLTINLPKIPQDLLNLHRDSQDNKQEPSIESLKGALHALLMNSAELIVVVDALEECSNPVELVQFIGEMRSWKTVDLRILVMSRKHFDGADELEELRPIQVSIQDELANNDILIFVDDVLNKDLKIRHWPTKVKDDIKSALVSKAGGMFRWVACQIDFLKKCRTQQDVTKVLLTLPQSLEETYDRILDTIGDTYKSDVRVILQWLTLSKRPMRLEEVAEIVAFDETCTAFDVNRRLLNPLEVLTMCSSLLVANETYFYDYEYKDTKVLITELRLAHFTVKDYLLSERLQQSRNSYYRIEEKTSSLQIAKSCLTYLNMEQLSCGYQGKRIHRDLLRQWPLLDYAAQFCGLCLRLVENDLDSSALTLLKKLLSTHILPNGGNLGTFIGTVWSMATMDQIGKTPPIYFAASYGLASVVKLLLTDVAAVDLEARGGRYGSTALQVASYRGNTDCVRLLLEAGADPNSTNDMGETSLLWAQVLKLSEIVHLLRSFGATR